MPLVADRPPRDPRGAKPGERRGGRQKGTLNKIIVEKKLFVERAKMQGITPLEVMLDNMYFCAADMPLLAKRLEDALVGIEEGDVSEEAMQSFERALNKLFQSRAMAQNVAVDAAPYMHPKFAAVATFNANDEKDMEFVLQIGDRAITTGIHRKNGHTDPAANEEDHIQATVAIS